MVFDPVPAARLLRQLRQDRAPVGRLPPGIAPGTAAEGAAVQAALAGLLDAIPPAGFKIGATGKRMQAYLGVDAPIAGFVRQTDLHQHHATLRFDDFIKPGVECEVAVRLARDLPPGPCSLAAALAAVGNFFAGIEIVDNRYGDDLGMPTLLADQMYHCAAVIGDRHDIDWRGLPIDALRGRISLDDGTADQGMTSDLMRHPLNGLAWLAGSTEAAAFGGLRAGQVVMLGSVTPPLWLRRPAMVTVSFPPLPAASVRLI